MIQTILTFFLFCRVFIYGAITVSAICILFPYGIEARQDIFADKRLKHNFSFFVNDDNLVGNYFENHFVPVIFQKVDDINECSAE